MRTWMAVGVLVLGASLAPGGRAGDKDSKPRAKDNVPPRGYVALFNGKDLTGWQGVIPLPQRKKLSAEQLKAAHEKANQSAAKHWTVQDGVLHYDGKGDSLQTVKDYGDFDLYLDWKIKKNGDSGIYLRGQPQVQIWDSENLADNLKADRGLGSGGLWNNPPGSKGKQPLKNADRPVGEWNTFHITMKGDLVTVVLNGVTVVDQAPLANYWERGKPLPATGPIELQHHGNDLWFKNIYIAEK